MVRKVEVIPRGYVPYIPLTLIRVSRGRETYLDFFGDGASPIRNKQVTKPGNY
jgi:hypothetical protein